jgi:hypothetical protein
VQDGADGQGGDTERISKPVLKNLRSGHGRRFRAAANRRMPAATRILHERKPGRTGRAHSTREAECCRPLATDYFLS